MWVGKMTLLFEIAIGYIAIVYGLIPLCMLVFSLFALIFGLIVRGYYAIEDYFGGNND